MKIGYFQFDVQHLNREANVKHVLDSLASHHFDIIVLPELFTTGYLFESKQELYAAAEDFESSTTLAALTDLACEKDGYIIATIPERVQGDICNTGFVVGPDGLVGKQRKIHLPRLEKPLFREGERLQTFMVKGVRLAIVTCFDSWFPEVFRLMTYDSVQLICQPANFGGPWTLDIMKVRAMENQLFAVVANRIGREQSGDLTASFRGESRIIDPTGDILNTPASVEQVCVLDVSLEQALHKRNLMCDDFEREWSRYFVEKKEI